MNTTETTTEIERIWTRNEYTDYRTKDGWVSHGELTKKQYAALEDCARLSPGFCFCVTCYGGEGSGATHVMVYRAASRDEVDNYCGLVGKKCAQYDTGAGAEEDAELQQVVKRVAHRVYKLSNLHFDR